jgi:CRP/FNR family transcriptional regulator, cyclic AMP receptor protein
VSWEELRQVPLFAALPAARLREIGARCAVRQVRVGSILARQGDLAPDLIIVIRGEVCAVHYGRTGDQVRMPSAVAPCILDKAAVLSGAPHPVTWTARAPSLIQIMSHRYFTSLLAAEPSMRDHALRYLSAQVMQARQDRVDRDTATTPARVATWLLQHHAARGQLVPLPAGQQGLAEELGLSRVTVNRVLQSFMRSGAVLIHRGAVQIIDASTLRAAASSQASLPAAAFTATMPRPWHGPDVLRRSI